MGAGAEEYESSNSHESVESNFVQSVEASVGGVSGFETGNDGPTEPSQANWPPLPSNGSLETDVSSTMATETVTDVPESTVSRTTNYEEVLMAETTSFDAQFTTYATGMSADIHTTAQSMLRDEEPTSLEHGDTTMSEEETTRTTITETSVTEFTTQTQDQSSSKNSGVKSFGDNGTSDINDIGDREGASSGDISSKLRQMQSRVGFDGPLMVVLTDRGIVEARPSVVRAETEILVHGDEVRHRNVEVQNRDFTPNNTVPQTTYLKNELSGDFDTLTTGVADVVGDTLSLTDTTTEAYPAVMVSETGSEATGISFVDDVATTSLQPVSEHTVIPATDTTVSSESGEDSLKLYQDTKLSQDFHPNSVTDANEFSASQTETSNSVQASELDNSLLYTATEAAQDSAVSKNGNMEHIPSESVSTDDRHVSREEPNTYFLPQALYKDADGTGLQLTPSKLNSTEAQSQPEKSESEISENILEMSEMTTEIPVTIRTELAVDETVTSLSGQTVTPSGKYDGTETGHIAQTTSEPSVTETDGVSVRRKEESSGDCDGNIIPIATEAEDVASEPTRRAECITEHFQSPDMSEPYEPAVSLGPRAEETESVSVQTERFSASETFTEHFNAHGTEQLTEITTLPSNLETTVLAKQTKIGKTEESVSSSSAEPTAGYRLRTDADIEGQEDSVFLNDVADPIPPSTVLHAETVVTSEGTALLPVVFDTFADSSLPSAAETSGPSSTTPAVAAPSAGATAQQTSELLPPCGVVTGGTSPGTQCWLVQFMNANSSVPVCVGSYLDASTIVTSAKGISRSEKFFICVDI
jgi:hypothetical protein